MSVPVSTGEVTPTILRFSTEQDLWEYAEDLNQAGESPQFGLLDSHGVQVLASRTAPGGDGWGFEYYSPSPDDGFMHCCACSDCLPSGCHDRAPGWKPAFPVFVMQAASLVLPEKTET